MSQRVFVTATAGPAPTAADWDGLIQAVDRCRARLAELQRPGVMQRMIEDALRPLHAEMALREKESGTHTVNSAARKAGAGLGAFKLPKAGD